MKEIFSSCQQKLILPISVDFSIEFLLHENPVIIQSFILFFMLILRERHTLLGFKFTIIAVSNFKFDPATYTRVDTFPTGPDTTLVFYTNPLPFKFEITNKHSEPLHAFSVHIRSNFSIDCNLIGNFKKMSLFG